MAIVTQGDDDLITGINVTPLVDIVLVLLVVLMVTASYVATRTVPVDLPRAATGESTPTTLVVSITADGALYVDAEPATDEELAARVAAAHRADPKVRAVIAADGGTPHRSVVRVIDILRRQQVTRFAINVDPSELADARR